MKGVNLPRPAGAHLLLAAFVCVLVLASCESAPAQARPEPRATAPPPPAQSAGATADEEFELNIDSRRISERDFQAGAAVEAGGARGLRLKVGADLRASDIEVLLTGVRGRVRFRGSLAPLLRLLDARRAADPEARTPAP